MQVKCMKCGHVGDESTFPKGRDFCQKSYVAACPKCDNRQSPGDASTRMFGGPRPFEYVRQSPTTGDTIATVFHQAGEAS
jgi:hypothetical protein